MTPPSIDEVRAWLGVPATVIDDGQLGDVIDAEVSAQARVCVIDDATEYPDLHQALLRRIGRAVAARNIPTGLVPGSEIGMARLPGTDVEFDRYEAPHRRMIVA